MRFRKGFTLVEILVVMAILGLITTVAVVNFNTSRMKARDAKRKTDFRQIRTALEMYYQENGFYPAAGGPAPSPNICASDWACWWSGGAFANTLSKFMPKLPQDPKYASRGSSVSCNKWTVYVYEKKSDNSFCLAGTLENTGDSAVLPCSQSCHRAWPNYYFTN